MIQTEIPAVTPGYTPTNIAQGAVCFSTGTQLTGNSASLSWDNTNLDLKVGSNTGLCIELKHRSTGDGLTPGPIDGTGYVNIINPTNGNTLSLGHYTFGELIRFNGDATGPGSESTLEFWGVDNIASSGAASPICTMVTSGSTHEVHCPRGNTDIDAIIHAIPVGSTPVIYTETGGNNILAFGVSRKSLFRITTTGANGTGNVLWTTTASATGKDLTHDFKDNGFSGTLKGRMIYAGSNGGGSQYFGLINDGGDYLALASNTTIFYNATFGTEYGRWTSTNYRPGSGNSFDLGASGNEWKNVYFLTQAIGPGGSASSPAYAAGATNYGMLASTGGGYVGFTVGGTLTALIQSGDRVYLRSVANISWDNADSFGSISLNIGRDAANILAHVNGTNAQTVRVYGTTTGPKYVSLSHDGTNGILDTAASSGRLTLGGNASTITLSSQLVALAGGAGTPSITFTGTTDGLYSRASGALDISIGGARTFEFDGANMYIVVNGSSYSLGSSNDCTFSRDTNGNALIKSSVRQVAFGSAANSTSATIGYMCIPSSAGAPTGVPSNIPTGQIPFQYDSTNNNLWAYNGGWKKANVGGTAVVFS